MKQLTPSWRRSLLLATLSLGLPALVAQTPVPVQNPTFADADTDGKPDHWKLYPDGDGLSTVSSGVRINDQSSSTGLGLAQWLPATEGTQYRATAEVQGTGGVFVYLIFTSHVPTKDAQVSQIKLLEKREWASGKTEKSTVTVNATAPAGAKHVRLWIYSPNASKADVTVSSIKLDAVGTVDVPPAAAIAPTAAATPAAPSAVIPSGPVPEGNLLQNPPFADTDGDGTPDSWEPYPPGDGSSRILATAPDGGLVFKDNDKNNGLGLEQWVPVQEGLRYVATANVSGKGGISLTLIFAKLKPLRAGDLKSVQLGEKSNRANAGKITETIGIAPAGATWAKVWLYSPKIGVADVVVRQLTLTASAPTANPVPPGVASVLDFETGDFSQAHSTEGGAVSVVKAAEAPVREGKFAAKAALKKGQVRAEAVGQRPPPYGVVRYGWSLYIPKEFDAQTHFSIVTQWHDWGTGRETPPDGGPPTSLTIDKGKWSLKLRYQTDDGFKSAKTYFPLGPVEEDRGQWTDWVMEVNWQPPGKGGWLKLYKNDKLVLDHKGTTFFQDKNKGPFFKFGIYKGQSRWKGDESGAILYLDSARMAIGENSTYQMVAPSAYSPRPTK